MDFNFRNYYSNYSTKDLLKILEKQQDYRPEAIVVIKDILSGRTDVEKEEHSVKTESLNDFFEKHRKQEILEKKYPVFFNLLALVRKPSLVKQDNYLILFLQVVLAFYYISLFPDRAKTAYYTFNTDYLGQLSFFFTGVMLLQLVSTPIIIYLLSVRNKTGWILSAIGKCIEVAYCLYNSWIICVKFGDYSGTRLKVTTTLYLLFVIGILVILFYQQTRQVLKITKQNIQFTLAVSIITIITGMLLINWALY